MYSFTTKVRVRYNETDRMGYLHHGVYPAYFEIGRTEMLRSLGMSYREMEDDGIVLPVSNLNIQYISPAYYDDVLIINTIIKQKPTVRLVFEYEVTNDSGKLVCQGETTLVFVNAITRKPTRAPQSFMERMEQYFKN
ncbi:MAG: acyl-CoA thioesterase [Bacteroidales bacterium]|nr:acyl-CoA thioesterase [Bacteroidales bacterium]